MRCLKVPFPDGHTHGSSGTISVLIPCDDLRETVVRDGGAERQTASEAFGEGVKTLVIESAVGTDHGFGNVAWYKIKTHMRIRIVLIQPA